MSAAQHTPDDPEVISWDIAERRLTDGSSVFDVVGTSDQCRVTLYCADEATAEALTLLLNSRMVCGAQAERLMGGMRLPVNKTCTRCRDDYPADPEFFRVKAEAGAGKSARYMPWCRACEAEQKAEARAITKAAIGKARSA